ncbi:DNA-binding protein [Salinadaptatus halalkaliphilus]|uniref:DNA-binding protein n=1 Tax=Salinadaptatus halalkaliphilus TaxID=2419781 RepID=A0A4S3TT78_9EURY|nr:helix-turn-helix domain-containing protein [Salinadaptatus halalkaliphilus]THE65808.1 DNA-binding protein [Salinadaptatus halalkaliphilus]
MGFIAEYEIGCDRLPLVTVAAAIPEATIDVDIQPTQDDRPPLIAHVDYDDIGALERAFDDVVFVASYTHVGREDDTDRYQIEPAVGMAAQLGDRIDDLSQLHDLASTDAVIDRIRVTPTGWVQRGWFADRAVLEEFRVFWQRNGTFTLRRLTRDHSSAEDDGLTDRQREAVRTAYEMGYFEIPRTATLEDVATELGITASSLSERLRRAQTHLVETAVSGPRPARPS